MMQLSGLGIFHTIIGVVAIIAAVTDFIKRQKIDLSYLTGKVYLYGTLIASLTALGLSKHGGFNPGHVFALFIVLLVSTAWFLYAKRQGKNRARFFENLLLSLSFFLSLVPTVNETFTRIPMSHPLASGPTDPVIGRTLLILLVLFIAGSVLQFRMQRRMNKSA